jgi:hypothetical protein
MLYLHGVSYHHHSTLYQRSTSAAIRFVVQYQEYVAPGGPGKSWISRRAVVASALTTIPEGQGSQFHIKKQGSRHPDNLQSREGEKQRKVVWVERRKIMLPAQLPYLSSSSLNSSEWQLHQQQLQFVCSNLCLADSNISSNNNSSSQAAATPIQQSLQSLRQKL